MTNLEKYVRITHGIHDLRAEVGGLSVAEVRLAYRDILSVQADAEVYVNGVKPAETTILLPGDRCEFMKTRGRKGQDFWSKREIMAMTGIPESEWDRLVEKGMKVVWIDEFEIVVDAEFKKWNQRMIFNDDTIERAAPVGRGGRPDTTADIAEFANRLKNEGKRWKEIVRKWQEEHPDDDRVKDAERMRGIWRRHYRK